MRSLFGISMIFLMVGLLAAPGCTFAAEFSINDNSASDFKLSASSEKVSPEVKGGSRGGFSSSRSSKAVKKVDGDDDDATDDSSDSGFPWWIILIIIVIILLAVAAVVWFAFLKK
ncbi:MAG: hypothetical protein CVV28_11335 [Methanobacteriales archaeon HGW-Methanobacteriales-1]|jgi:cobalamin biosynthesis Mg chelatase CobN|nr:MAG: hypothetical protein CVV28_11335 [Methanobacteriales archaeon HGW-Methanobacteriales-1]